MQIKSWELGSSFLASRFGEQDWLKIVFLVLCWVVVSMLEGMYTVLKGAFTLLRAAARLGLFVAGALAACLVVMSQLRVAALFVVPLAVRFIVRQYRKFRQDCWNLPWFGILWCAVGYGSFMARYGYQAFPGTIVIATLIGFAAWRVTQKRLSVVALLMLGAVTLNGFAFTQFGMGGHFTCTLQDGVRPVLGECTVPPVERPEGVVIGPSAMEMFFASLPGAPPLGEFEYSPRDAVLCANGTAICAVFGQADRLDLQSAALKIDIDSGDVVGTLWMYTAFSVKCSDRHNVCTIVSEQGNRVYLVSQETWEVEREFDLRGLLPSYQVVISPDEIAILLMQGSGVDKSRVPTYGPVTMVQDQYSSEAFIGVLDLARLQFVVRPIKGKLPEPFMGDERLFASYDAEHNYFMVGSSLAAIDMTEMTVTTPKGGVVQAYLGDIVTGGAFVDPVTKLVYANHPFGGVVKYAVRDGKFEEVGRIRVKMGGRPLEYDLRRGLLYSGNYGRGYVEVIDPRTQEALTHWKVGRNLRNVHFFRGNSPGDDRLVVASSTGVYLINLADALGEGTLTAKK
jgi:hypothetical protein